MRSQHRIAFVVAFFLMMTAGSSLGAGSWVASHPGPRVAMVDATTRSQPLSPPKGLIGEGRITRVSWRFELPAATSVTARLCHPRRCISLERPQGSTDALAGLDAEVPLTFHFRLARPGPAIQTRGLQVIVNYREG